MQIGNVQNQYITNHYQEGAQAAAIREAEARTVKNLSEYQHADYRREEERRLFQWLAYVMMMEFFAKQGMWNMLNLMHIQKTLDIKA